MSKWQFWTLNIAGGLCALLIAINLVLAQLDVRLNKAVAEMQGRFGQAQRLQNTAQSLIGRLAEASQKEVALRDLLARHNFRFTQNTEPAAARVLPTSAPAVPSTGNEKEIPLPTANPSGSSTNARTGKTP